MPDDDPNAPEKPSSAIVCTLGGICPYCRAGWEERPVVEVMTIERKADRIASSGRIPMRHCPRCMAAINAINHVVPIELGGFVCECGGKEFRFSIRSLKPNKVRSPDEWNFDLDVTCTSCRKRKLRERLLNIFRLKRVKLGATGVDLEMFPAHKS